MTKTKGYGRLERHGTRPVSLGADFSDETADSVIEEFSKDSPSELELIATALHVYIQTKDKVKNGVLKIKGSKYSEMRIDSAIERLIRTGYIAA